MTIASMIDKYERKLAQVGPGQPAEGYLIEEVLDDLADCVVQGSSAELVLIKAKARQEGYNAAMSEIKRKVNALVAEYIDGGDRMRNGG